MRRSCWTTIGANTEPRSKPATPPEADRLHRQWRRLLDVQQETVVRGRSPRSKLQYRSNQRVDVAAIGAVIDDSGAYRELAVKQRRRRCRDPGFLNVDDDIAIYLVGVGGPIAEADDVELDRREQLQPRLGQNTHLQISGERT